MSLEMTSDSYRKDHSTNEIDCILSRMSVWRLKSPHVAPSVAAIGDFFFIVWTTFVEHAWNESITAWELAMLFWLISNWACLEHAWPTHCNKTIPVDCLALGDRWILCYFSRRTKSRQRVIAFCMGNKCAVVIAVRRGPHTILNIDCPLQIIISFVIYRYRN